MSDDLPRLELIDASAHPRQAILTLAASKAEPSLEELAERLPLLHFVLAGKAHERASVKLDAREVPPRHFEYRGHHLSVGGGAGMRDFGRSRLHAFRDLARTIGFSDRPQRARQIGRCADDQIVPIAKRMPAIARGVENLERSLQTDPRLR